MPAPLRDHFDTLFFLANHFLAKGQDRQSEFPLFSDIQNIKCSRLGNSLSPKLLLYAINVATQTLYPMSTCCSKTLSNRYRLCSRTNNSPSSSASSLPGDIDGQTILLVDDVIHSGRTIRAAMNELFDYGRPERILLATLIDRGGRELPIQPDFVAERMELAPQEQIKLEGPQPLSLKLQRIEAHERD